MQWWYPRPSDTSEAAGGCNGQGQWTGRRGVHPSGGGGPSGGGAGTCVTRNRTTTTGVRPGGQCHSTAPQARPLCVAVPPCALLGITRHAWRMER